MILRLYRLRHGQVKGGNMRLYPPIEPPVLRFLSAIRICRDFLACYQYPCHPAPHRGQWRLCDY